MKNIIDPSVHAEVLERINRVQSDSPAQWGKMNAGEMLCHLTDVLRIANGEIYSKPAGNFFTHKIMKNLVLAGLPAPKGKARTMPEVDQKIGGTRPTNFEADRKALVNRINSLVSGRESLRSHPFFGELSHREWGRLSYVHMDHHLKQFGV